MAKAACGGCGGTGVTQFARAAGVCFRCGGKGFQDAADVRRNAGYDAYRMDMDVRVAGLDMMRSLGYSEEAMEARFGAPRSGLAYMADWDAALEADRR